MRRSGNENFFWKCFGWIAAWMTKTQREQSLAKPSTIHMLILIPVMISLLSCPNTTTSVNQIPLSTHKKRLLECTHGYYPSQNVTTTTFCLLHL
jgi:hypothetical protein